MDNTKIKTLQRLAIDKTIDCVNESINAKGAKGIKQLSNLHIAAFMDITKTTQSLQYILEYKKEISIRIINTSNEEQLDALALQLNHSERLIKKTLGMCL